MAYAEICKIKYLRSFQTLLQRIEENQDTSGREEIKFLLTDLTVPILSVTKFIKKQVRECCLLVDILKIVSRQVQLSFSTSDDQLFFSFKYTGIFLHFHHYKVMNLTNHFPNYP